MLYSLCVLVTIKLLHTVIWAVLAACVLAVPVLGLARRFRAATFLSAVILMEWAFGSAAMQ